MSKETKGALAVGMVLAVIGLIGTIAYCACPNWKQSVGPENVTMEGIWVKCEAQARGETQCKKYDPVDAMPEDLRTARPLTVASIVLSILGILLMIVGADFNHSCVGKKNTSVKKKISVGSGIVVILAGVLLIIPVSLSAIAVGSDTNEVVTSGIKMESGTSIVLGWVFSVMLMVAGALVSVIAFKKLTDHNSTYV
ncbi:claudin-9-like [Latimeria chalumnae]|uniref:claudin-9-like n=1 Tax=Latimeria chalumnae TaxID=7897 RepID=UPI0003C11BDA|nr:PREDICTED: claudin-9-like [Latimeria chalumnae]|eukprot:XP_014353324.1 PREDICTED: claudin-9-like [Latimeria chalumnae]